MGWIADSVAAAAGNVALTGKSADPVDHPGPHPPVTCSSSSSFRWVSLRVFKLAVIGSLHLQPGTDGRGPFLLMLRAWHHIDDFAVPWGTACLLPKEQREPVDHGILPSIRSTEAVVASGGRAKGEYPMKPNTMNTEERELSPDELESVRGGLAGDILMSIGGAILSVIPGANAAYATGVVIGNAVTGQNKGLF
jgi:hypothetical protein